MIGQRLEGMCRGGEPASFPLVGSIDSCLLLPSLAFPQVPDVTTLTPPARIRVPTTLIRVVLLGAGNLQTTLQLPLRCDGGTRF